MCVCVYLSAHMYVCVNGMSVILELVLSLLALFIRIALFFRYILNNVIIKLPDGLGLKCVLYCKS